MKRFFNNQPAGDVVLSMEEEAILFDQAQSDIAESTAALSAAGRAAETDSGLDDVSEIVDSIEKPTEVDTALASDVKDMAVAGTDIAVDELDGGEGEEGAGVDGDGNISTEGITDTIREIWQSIMAMLAKAWKAIKNFFASIFGAIENIDKRIDKCLVLMKAHSGKVATIARDAVQVKGRRDAFMMNGKALEVDQLPMEWKVLNGFVKNLFHKTPEHVLEFGKQAEDFFKSVTGQNVDAKTSELADKVSKNVFDYSKLIVAGGQSDVESNSFIGNFSVTVVGSENLRAATDPLAKMKAAQAVKFTVKNHGQNGKDDRDANSAWSEAAGQGRTQTIGYSYAVKPADVYVKLLMELSEAAKTILEYKRGGFADKLEKQGDTLRNASNEAIRRLKEEDTKLAAALKPALGLNSTYSRWAGQPMSDCIKGIGFALSHQVLMCEKVQQYYSKQK